MGEDCPADVVAAHVCMCIGCFGCTEERETHEISAGGETVLAVV